MKLNKCCHTEFRMHTRVIVMMRDGTKFVDKYIGKKSGVIILSKKGRISLDTIRNVSIYRK